MSLLTMWVLREVSEQMDVVSCRNQIILQPCRSLLQLRPDRVSKQFELVSGSFGHKIEYHEVHLLWHFLEKLSGFLLCLHCNMGAQNALRSCESSQEVYPHHTQRLEEVDPSRQTAMQSIAATNQALEHSHGLHWVRQRPRQSVQLHFLTGLSSVIVRGHWGSYSAATEHTGPNITGLLSHETVGLQAVALRFHCVAGESRYTLQIALSRLHFELLKRGIGAWSCLLEGVAHVNQPRSLPQLQWTWTQDLGPPCTLSLCLFTEGSALETIFAGAKLDGSMAFRITTALGLLAQFYNLHTYEKRRPSWFTATIVPTAAAWCIQSSSPCRSAKQCIRATSGEKSLDWSAQYIRPHFLHLWGVGV